MIIGKWKSSIPLIPQDPPYSEDYNEDKDQLEEAKEEKTNK